MFIRNRMRRWGLSTHTPPRLQTEADPGNGGKSRGRTSAKFPLRLEHCEREYRGIRRSRTGGHFGGRGGHCRKFSDEPDSAYEAPMLGNVTSRPWTGAQRKLRTYWRSAINSAVWHKIYTQGRRHVSKLQSTDQLKGVSAARQRKPKLAAVTT